MNPHEALTIAIRAHAGQRDKCGADYILHPLAVAEAVRPLKNDEITIVALLHDVLEDTDTVLIQDDFWHTEWDALKAITKNIDGPETYYEYIDRVAQNRTASYVKLADLWHNLSPERQNCLPDEERASLTARYTTARQRIWTAQDFSWWPDG